MHDLAAYAELTNRLAAMRTDDEITIQPADFPATLDDHTPFDGMVIDTSFVRFISWADGNGQPFTVTDRSTGFDGFALPEGYRRFGLWLLHVLFSGRDWAGLTLTHPLSRAQHLYLRVLRPASAVFGLQRSGKEAFSGYVYAPQQVSRHPFADAAMTPVDRVDPFDRPFFAFGWSDQQALHQWDISRSDQIILEATPAGIAAFAALMIDMAHPELGREEINLEPPVVGFAATQARSIEARFWLPGSFAFYCDDLDGLELPPFR